MSGTDIILIVLILAAVFFLLLKSAKKQNKCGDGCASCVMKSEYSSNYSDDGGFSKTGD